MKLQECLKIAESWGFKKEVIADIRWQKKRHPFRKPSFTDALQEWDIPPMLRTEWEQKQKEGAD